MTGVLLAQPYPGAITCVVVGPLDAVRGLDFAPFKEILWCVTAHTPMPPALLRRTVSRFAVDDPQANFALALDEFILRTPNRLPSVFITTGVARDAKLYDSVIEQLHASLESYHRARLTRLQDGFSWQKHVLANVVDYGARRIPAAWRNQLKGLPAFVVGAGPSLDISASVLARHARDAVIFSSDSALRTLAQLGVAADFAVSIDRAKVPEKCLPAEQRPSQVVLSVVSPPQWQEVIPAAQRWYVSSAQITLDWLATQGIPRTEINATESCGSTALELARFLGCAPIYLFGLDLAADTKNPAKRHHSGVDRSIYVNSGYDATRKQPMAPGNYEAQVPTFVFGDWRVLDARIAEWPQGLVWNVNDRGAKLRNTTLVHPSDFALAPIAGNKAAPVAGLLQPESEAPAEQVRNIVSEALAPIRLALPRLQNTLERSGPAALVGELRALLTRPHTASVLGAYAFKLMPKLFPPIDPDRELWRQELQEIETLANESLSKA